MCVASQICSAFPFFRKRVASVRMGRCYSMVFLQRKHSPEPEKTLKEEPEPSKEQNFVFI